MAVAGLVCSCQPEEEKNYSLSVNTESLTFASVAAQPQTVVVDTENVDWTFDIPADAQSWLSAEKGAGELIVTVTDNIVETVRSSSIKISATSHGEVAKPCNILVSQEAGESAAPEYVLAVDRTELHFGEKDNAPQEITVTAEGEGLTWEAVVDFGASEWLSADVEADKIVVSVSDSDVYSIRTGRITVRTNIADVPKVEITVSQDECTTKPYIKVDPLSLEFGAIDKSEKIITVDCFGMTWKSRVDGFDNNWCSVWADRDAGTITVSVDRNITSSQRSGTITVQPDDDGFEDIVITVTQAGNDSDATSSLVDDVELSDESFEFTSVSVSTDYSDKMPYIVWNVTLRSEAVNYDSGQLAGEGDYMSLRLVTEPVEDFSVIPAGEYPVDDYHVIDPQTQVQEYHAPCVVPGKYTRPGFYGASSYKRFENGEEAAGTAILGGSLNISHEGEGRDAVYTVVLSFTDDAENTISGTFTGKFTEYTIINNY